MAVNRLLQLQILQMYACVGPTNPAVRPAHDVEYQQFGSGGRYFVPQRIYTAYWLTLANKGQIMSDADLLSLPAVPEWMVTPAMPCPAFASNSGAFNKYIRQNGGVDALIAKVMAGTAQP